ncbi:MAG: DNA helicase RecQ [Neisseriales bacterium]|nr:MAG: DNA helicase RecQ [Neisseriales bacterium]
MKDRALAILQETFGYAAFRGDQAAIIEQVLSGGHALALMSTGGGKSLCYQLPALIRSGITIVISPLIALMQNQVAALTELGIKAACLHSSMVLTDIESVFQAIRKNQLTLLYVAPERLLMPAFLKLLDQLSIALFAIDEAHCVSQWGYYFRHEYQQLGVLAKRYPHVPRLALTATADEQTCQDIVHYLDLSTAKKFVSSFDRPNLFYQVVEKNHAKRQLLDFIRSGFMGTSGIVYCLSRKRVDQVTQWLCEHGIDALPYHAGLDPDVRTLNQRAFLYQDNRIMVATVAFGLGIDKPDIRFVAHLDMPKSMENFYQESGRAGRDELPATSWLCYGLNDFIQLKGQIVKSQTAHIKQIELNRLKAVLAFCEYTGCRRQYILRYFCEASEPCGYCDNCLRQPKTVDATVAAQQLMSCIYRAKQSFSAQHIVDILRGNRTPLVAFHRHDQLSTYGMGKTISEKTWRALIRQLIAQELLDVEVTTNQALYLLEKSRSVLKRQATVTAKLSIFDGKDQTKGASIWLRSERQERLWEALRAWRSRIVANQQVPTYVIFSDRTLRELVEKRPTNLAGLMHIYGIGKTKLARYGEALLAILLAV